MTMWRRAMSTVAVRVVASSRVSAPSSSMVCVNPAWERERRKPPPVSKSDKHWLWGLIGLHIAVYVAHQQVMPRILVYQSDREHGEEEEEEADRLVRRANKVGRGEQWVARHVLLSRNNLEEGRWWTAFTYSLCHANVMHLALNMMCIDLMGAELLPLIGRRRFLMLHVAGVVGGAAAHCVSPFRNHGALPGRTTSPPTYSVALGASAAAFALNGALVMMFPRMLMRRMVFNGPLTFRQYTAAWVMVNALIEVASLPVGGMAHIGGLLAGMACGTFWFLRSGARYTGFLRRLLACHSTGLHARTALYYRKK
jgi:membrane associated rhomboid family serine protease